VTILRELIAEIGGMFIADGRLPIWLIGWIVAIGVLSFLGVAGLWLGTLLLAGVALILATNVLGAARSARAAGRGTKS
jgi:hypothetical protein